MYINIYMSVERINLLGYGSTIAWKLINLSFYVTPDCIQLPMLNEIEQERSIFTKHINDTCCLGLVWKIIPKLEFHKLKALENHHISSNELRPLRMLPTKRIIHWPLNKLHFIIFHCFVIGWRTHVDTKWTGFSFKNSAQTHSRLHSSSSKVYRIENETWNLFNAMLNTTT